MKKLLLTVILIISGICIAIDGWFGFLYFFGENKATNSTFYLSDMQVAGADKLEDSSLSLPFCEVEIYDNALEFKFNYFTDETQSHFYTSGIQLILKDENKSVRDKDIFDGKYSDTPLKRECIRERSAWVGDGATVADYFIVKGDLYLTQYNEILTGKTYTYLDMYEYSSFDNFEKTSTVSNYLTSGEGFMPIEFNGKTYGLSFKNYDTKAGSDLADVSNLISLGTYTPEPTVTEYWNFLVKHIVYDYTDTFYYRALDLTYFLETIGNACLSLPEGMQEEIYYNVPNILNYYEYDESNNKYTLLNDASSDLMPLKEYFKTYMKIKVKVNPGKLTSSSQSLLNAYAGNMNYGNDDSTHIDYDAGRVLVNVDIDDLELVETTESGVYKFKLSNEFVSKYSEYNSIYLNVVIDYESLNIDYGGFDLEDNKNFTIYKITNGSGQNLLLQEVLYA